MRNLDILSPNPRIKQRNSPQNKPNRLQNDKMPEKWFFAGYCVNKKKAVTLSQLKKPRDYNQYIIITSNFN